MTTTPSCGVQKPSVVESFRKLRQVWVVTLKPFHTFSGDSFLRAGPQLPFASQFPHSIIGCDNNILGGSKGILDY